MTERPETQDQREEQLARAREQAIEQALLALLLPA